MFCYHVVVQFKMGHTECSVTMLLCSLRWDILSVLLPCCCTVYNFVHSNLLVSTSASYLRG